MKQKINAEEIVGTIERGSPEWNAAQEMALRKSNVLVSKCHPYVPAIRLRRSDTQFTCGFYDEKRREYCGKFVRDLKIWELDSSQQAPNDAKKPPILTATAFSTPKEYLPTQKAPGHGLERKDMLAGNAYQPEDVEWDAQEPFA